jgi:hypothetical protein
MKNSYAKVLACSFEFTYEYKKFIIAYDSGKLLKDLETISASTRRSRLKLLRTSKKSISGHCPFNDIKGYQ